jgi:hypothetical protein
MNKRAAVITILAGGLLWGLSEIFLGDVFYRFNIPMRASGLTAIGITILVVARLVLDRPGSSLAVALIAGGLRCLVPKMYICHFVAIALEGCAFDISWTLLGAGDRRSVARAWLSGAIAVYTGFLGFGLISAYGFGFGRWVAAGFPGVIGWTLKAGSTSALLLAGLVPLGIALAKRLAAVYSPETGPTT